MERYHVREALRALWPTLVYVPLAEEGGSNAWLTIPVKRGKTVVFWRPPIPTADTTEIGESAVDPTPLGISASVVSGTAAEYANSVVITDWSFTTPIKSAQEVAIENMAEKAARSFNILIYGKVSGGGTAKYSKLSADAPKTIVSNITDKCILDKRQLEELAFYLRASKVRPYRDGLYKYVSAPACIKDLRAEATAVVGWNDALAAARMKSAMEMRGWEVGNMCGFKITETTEINSVISTSMSAGDAYSYGYYNTYAGFESVGAVSLAGSNLPKPPKGAKTPPTKKMQDWKPANANIQLIIKRPGGAGLHDPLNRRGSIGYKFNTLVKVLNATCCGPHFCGSTGSPTGTANAP